MSSPRIFLVRHGPSAYSPFGEWLNRDGVERWRVAYDAAGVQPESKPPRDVCELATSATHFVASDLTRAMESAARLAPNRSIVSSPLLQEIPLPIPRWPSPLPLAAWGLVIHAAWSWRMVRGNDPEVAYKDRVADAANWLTTLAGKQETVLAVTHGVARRSIGRYLCANGWAETRRREGYRPWSVWEFASVGG